MKEEELDETKGHGITSFCFMVKDQENKITNDKIEFPSSYNELHESFENLMEGFHKVLIKYFSTIEEKSILEKEHESLK